MKIKENIKKIGNRKNCLLLALLILALLFTVLMPKINIGTQKASALNAPQTKTLDLNGQSYSYQTSLNELKNNYGFFNNRLFRTVLTMQTDSEGYNYLTDWWAEGQKTEEQRNNIIKLLNNNINLYKNDLKYSNGFEYDQQSTVDYEAFTWSGNENEFNLTNITDIEIDINAIISQDYLVDASDISIFNRPYTVSFYYLNSDISPSATSQEVWNNTKIENYYFTKKIKFKYKVNNINNFKLRGIIISFENEDENTPNQILMPVLSAYPSYSGIYDQNQINSDIIIDNIQFIENEQSNIIKFDTKYWTYKDIVFEKIYQGSLLLSNNKYDNNLVNYFNNNPTVANVVQGFGNGVFFGGYAGNTGIRVTNLYYHNFPGVSLPGGTTSDRVISGNSKLVPSNFNDNPTLFSMNFNFGTSKLKNIQYFEQNQLVYVPEPQALTIKANTTQTYSGAGLSAMVEDVLYNVEYLGATEQIQQEQEIQKDFENMLYVTGAFAVIGLLLGFVFGNPVLGLVIGAIVGFGLTIIPIILDGLQAIFGQQFLDGLQNFFRSIASAIAGVVSSILNFLFSIITNPAVLVLVLIVAILYLFVFRKK